MRGEILKRLDHDPHFVWRGQNVSRIENLADIVFALSLSMLLLSGTPPSNYGELIKFLTGLIPVAAGFGVLFAIWNAHFTFFRRYGLADGMVVFLNSLLLLMVLFIAYPLRFIFDSLFGYIVASVTGDWSRLIETDMDLGNAARSVAIFGVAYAANILLISLMYGYALRKAPMLELSEREKILTRRSCAIYGSDIFIALGVSACALLTPMGPFAGALMGFSGLSAFVFARIFSVKSGA